MSNLLRKTLPALASILVPLSLFAATGTGGNAGVPDPLGWPAVTREARPWTRWWWLGSAVDKENLTRQLTLFQQAGLGGRA